MCGIYIIINKINDKCYVVQAIDIKSRFTNHKSTAFNKNDPGYNYPLYRAIRKYGIENFSFEVLEQCHQDKLNEREMFYIAQYRAHGPGGYNQTDGGDCAIIPQKLTKENVEHIMHRLATSLDSCKTIGDDFNVSPTMIEAINRGKSWHVDGIKYPIRQPLHDLVQKDKTRCCNCGKPISPNAILCPECLGESQRKVKCRPSPLELAEKVKNLGFEAVGRMFGVSGNTIKDWCIGYSIPYKKSDLISWYNKQMNILPEPKKQRTPIAEIVRPIKQIDKNTGKVLNVFPSIMAAARALGNENMNRNIGKACHGLIKTACGYIWEFA